MRVALRGVEEEIDDARTRNVRSFGGDIGEDDAGCDRGGGPCTREGEKVLLAEVGEAEEPKDGFGDGGENAEVKAESGGVDLWMVSGQGICEVKGLTDGGQSLDTPCRVG